ncbi:MAG: HAMP domain-containing histidine kinase [Solirubrobacterales bacterium]|nr:HAMP domain-containing histidine kinase [Solirubrobacterales bacterium]MCB8915924.1 HAMP domain-containing histidine kinase [Thermoleophilales bacterium]
MRTELTNLLPLLVALLLVAAREAWYAHRRHLVNRALHEARRPLQAIALALPAGPGRMTPALPVWQAIRALGEVDRQVNGGAPDQIRPEPIACRLMTEACVRRWQSRARMAGGGIEMRWTGPEALVTGDPAVLSGAIENLIVNAIEHGGPRIMVRVLVIGRRLRIEVTDDGQEKRSPDRYGNPSEVMAKLRGSQRHGHGLAVVREVAREHDGRFEIEIGSGGSTATLTLPCLTRITASAPGLVGIEG